MAVRKDTINLDIRINGENAGKKLGQLRSEAKQLRREMDQLDPSTEAFARKASRLQSINTTLSDISKSTSAVGKGFSSSTASLTTFLAAYASIGALRSSTIEIFNQIKQINSLNEAYRLLIPETDKRARADQFLTEVAQNYGLELTKLRDEYIKYNASAKASNLALEDQELIFESVAKAGSVLGLSTETQSRAFTALQQIMSKGKVSAEELKGQLGDALPGAVTIMAQALGVGTAELGKMLEAGEVMADEALPKFARELQKAYGVDQVKTINNISAAQNRFKNTFAEIVSEIGERAAPLIIQGFELLSKLVGVLFSFINVLLQIPAFIRENRIQIGLLVIALVSLNAQSIKTNALLLITAARQRGAAIATTAYTTAQRLLNTAMKANPIGLIVSALALLIGGLVTAYQRSETFRAAINGLGNVAKTFFTIIKEAFTAFGDGLRLIKEGEVADGLKKIGEGLRKSNPVTIAFTEGKRLGDAFNQGYKDSLKKSADDKAAKDLLAANAKITTALTNTTNLSNNTSAGSGKPAKTDDKPDKVKVDGFTDIFTASAKYLQEELKRRQQSLEEGLDKELDLLLTAKLKGQITEQEFDTQTLQRKRDFKDQEIALLASFGLTETNAYRDAINARLQLEKDAAERAIEIRLEGLRKSSELELLANEENFLRGLITEEEYNAAALELKKSAIQQQIDLLKNSGLGETDEVKKKELEKLRIEKEISDQRIEIAKREADLKKQLSQATFDTTLSFVDLGIELLGKDREARKKNAGIIKTFETGRVLAQLYSEISGYYASQASKGAIGIALASVLSLGASARAAINISKIRNQQFRSGGLLDGPSHEQGGIPVTIGGVQVAEAEGGEAFINRRSSAAFRPILSAINSFNGWGRKFETGGVLPGVSISPNQLSSTIATSSTTTSRLETKIEALIDFLGSGLNVRANVVYTDVEAAATTINNLRRATST